MTLARLRIISGVIIGLYVTMHLSNHALGLISINAQETARPWVMALWHIRRQARSFFMAAWWCTHGAGSLLSRGGDTFTSRFGRERKCSLD